ncbi:MAG: hypothetical protein FK734_16420 [Asgard group archaeon]|nr:hypothetical protein [Asgard group archaeon]
MKKLSFKEKISNLSTRTIVIAIVGIIIVGSFIGFFVWSRNNREYNYGYIVVAEDKDFTKRYNFPGAGTQADPYRIENLVINVETVYGILIYETTSHFVIRNCTVSGNAGIYIQNVADSTCRIENNTIKVLANSYGIGIDHVIDGKIINNYIYSTVSNAMIGINVFSSSYIEIKENIITSITHGIEIWGYSDFASITFNDCNNCDLGIFLDARDWFAYPQGYVDGHLEDITVSNNTCLNNNLGIYLLAELSDTTIIYNNCSLNNESGIESNGCTSINILANNLKNNTVGITLIETTETEVGYNQIENSSGYGVNATDCHYLFIHENNFINNNLEGQSIGEAQAYDNNPVESSEGENKWHDIGIMEGNYWNDLAWNPSATYTIDGANNVDLYPKEFPYGAV